MQLLLFDRGEPHILIVPIIGKEPKVSWEVAA